MRTTVAIIGAGPAGLLLARMLYRAGIDCRVVEARSRDYVQRRQRAGTLEQGTVDALRACGAAGRLDRDGLVHQGIELRWAHHSVRIDLQEHTGRAVTLYPQTRVVRDLIEVNQRDGVTMEFDTEAVAIEDVDGPHPRVHVRRGDRYDHIDCDFVAGCDGFHGATRTSLPADQLTIYQQQWPYSWLGVLANVPPSCTELIYAHSPRGFALHSMRTAEISRLYLQVPNDTDPASWPYDRIWDELAYRLGADTSWQLRRGPITETAVLPLRSVVIEPMSLGHVFLAGDAAHIVPATGAKGLNLAVADVQTLAAAFAFWHATGSTELLDAYSATCLNRVWQAQQFCADVTRMLHRNPGQTPLDTRLQLAQLTRLASSRPAAAAFAASYTGTPATP
jgi:p-hydroxybenzoate 3-monooxygenase